MEKRRAWQDEWIGENAYPRLSSDSPNLNDFWRLAPSVRLSALSNLWGRRFLPRH